VAEGFPLALRGLLDNCVSVTHDSSLRIDYALTLGLPVPLSAGNGLRLSATGLNTARLRAKGACRGRMRNLATDRRCQLPHERAARAVIRVRVISSRVGKQGHPMQRDMVVCAGHARQLRDLGIEVVRA
jgi:hypothetical protein